MRILADENVNRPIIEWLRSQGHDILAMAERDPGLADTAVLDEATMGGRVVITFDLDYGSLVYRSGKEAAGILLLRLRALDAPQLLSLFQSHWPEIERKIQGHFIVATNTRLRVRPLPE